MFSIIKFIIFLVCSWAFGYISLSRLLKIRSLVLLIPLSVSFGIAAYVFTCHILSFLIGTQKAAWISVIILVFESILIFFINRKNSTPAEKEITTSQLITISTIAIFVYFLTFMAVSKFGTFDREAHIPIAMTMFHNNVYPPRDCFRSDYVLLYHYGGDLLAGAIQYITNLDISTSYELVAAILSGTTFLSFFALCWLLTSGFKLSLLGGFCAYFGGGLLWLDAIIRYLTKNFPDGVTNWSFLQTFLNLGIHGGINNAPSVLTFISTFNLGNPILICSLILFWKMIQEKNIKSGIYYIFFLTITLFILYLTADWLYVTFWVAVLPFTFFLWKDNKKQFIISTLIILFISVLLNKSVGNPLFLQDPLQALGRTNIFDAGIKERLFSVVGWGRISAHVMNYQTISCFSWDFICEIGLSLFLFSVALIYLIKTKSRLGYLLFLVSAMTMPIPVLIDFKLNPVELVRLFAFGNTMLILLITCGMAFLYKPFVKNNFLLIPYAVVFCLSPFSQLIFGAVFSPHIYSNKSLVQTLCNDLKKIKSLNELLSYLRDYSQYMHLTKSRVTTAYKSEMGFFRSQSKPGDVALSTIHEIPAYTGVYSLIPTQRFVYWDLLYSPHNTLYETAFSTLDPYLLKELNIKWLLINPELKIKLPKETQDTLNNSNIFSLAFISPNKLEIYHINDLKNILKISPRKTAWMLINRNGYPVTSGKNKIVLFPSLRNALIELKSLQSTNPILKKQLITACAVIIQSLEKQIVDSKINIDVEKRFSTL